jgi:hypothetical protein
MAPEPIEVGIDYPDFVDSPARERECCRNYASGTRVDCQAIIRQALPALA